MSSSYRITLDRWLDTVEVKAESVLDIGGSQLPVKNRVKRWDVKHYVIADLDTPHVGSPKPDLVLDMNERFNGSVQYDQIFCLEVFDYVFDPMTAFKNLEKLMKPGATAWVSFPFAYPTHNPIQDDMLRYTEFAIYKLAQVVDLAVLELVKRRPETDLLNLFYTTERMRAAKHYDHSVTGFIAKLYK